MKNRKKLVLAVLAIGVLLVGAVLARKIVRRVRAKTQAMVTAVAAVTDPGPRHVQPLEAADVIYDQKLAPGWDDWGWGPHRLGEGPAKIVFKDYGGWLIHHGSLPWRYGGLS
ncbi:MAG TPA: hypothetical protein VEQ59_04590, partial [Polyangiaceae bacterium]|nr:hypothetical protein [Polyangiaceae bacterium]